MKILTPVGDGGEALRDDALKLLRARLAELICECTFAALRVAPQCDDECADDVRAVVAIPDGISPKLVGVVFCDLVHANILPRDGFRNSNRPAAHARPLSVWKLADASAAASRLAAVATP